MFLHENCVVLDKEKVLKKSLIEFLTVCNKYILRNGVPKNKIELYVTENCLSETSMQCVISTEFV